MLLVNAYVGNLPKQIAIQKRKEIITTTTM